MWGRVLRWPAWRAGVARLWRALRGPVAANAVLLGVLTALGHWELYLLLWLLPLATWYQLAARIRDAAEHAMVADGSDPLRNTRTVTASLLERVFLAPYWVSYHLEHHLFVFVPCWSLHRAHALLLAKGYGARMEVAPSYVEVIRRVTLGPVEAHVASEHATRRAGIAALITVVLAWGLVWPVNKVLLETFSPCGSWPHARPSPRSHCSASRWPAAVSLCRRGRTSRSC